MINFSNKKMFRDQFLITYFETNIFCSQSMGN